MTPLQSCCGCGCCCEDWPYDSDSSDMLAVTYDWPVYQTPTGMAVHLYPFPDGSYWRFDLRPTGGLIRTDFGTYNVVSYNNDTESVRILGDESFGSLQASTWAGRINDGVAEAFRGPEPPRSDPSEPVQQLPQTLYVAVAPQPFDYTAANRRLRLSPELFTPMVRVTVSGITHIASAANASMALSGMAGGKFMATSLTTADAVTYPAQMSVMDSVIQGQMRCFGLPDPPSEKNILTVYVWLWDAKKQAFNYDVTGQLRGQADSDIIDVRVSGMELPEVKASDDVGNIQVGMDNWEIVDIELSN